MREWDQNTLAVVLLCGSFARKYSAHRLCVSKHCSQCVSIERLLAVCEYTHTRCRPHHVANHLQGVCHGFQSGSIYSTVFSN